MASSPDRDAVAGRITAENPENPERAEAIDHARTVAAVGGENQKAASRLHLHIVGIVFLYVVSAAVLISLLVLFWNYAAPSYWRFLSDDQVSKLQGFVLSGLVGSGLTQGVKRIFE